MHMRSSWQKTRPIVVGIEFHRVAPWFVIVIAVGM